MRQGKLRQVLTDCIREMETRGGSLGERFNRRPEQIKDLQELLGLWRTLDSSAKAVPAYAGQLRGQQKMLTALAEMGRKGGERKMIPTLLAPAAAKAVAVVAAAAFVTGGAAGASAALGGPDVFSTVGITAEKETAKDTLEAVDENTPAEADEGLDTAKRAVEDGLDIAGDNADDEAQDGLDMADSARNGETDGLGTAGERAPDEATDGLSNAE